MRYWRENPEILEIVDPNEFFKELVDDYKEAEKNSRNEFTGYEEEASH